MYCLEVLVEHLEVPPTHYPEHLAVPQAHYPEQLEVPPEHSEALPVN
jgi:hypothetical protein